MSFVGKAVKKIFNFHKKLHQKIKKAWGNKWVRGVVIAAIAVFAVGLGSGGFKNWSKWSQESGGFWNAVGKTFAQGWGTIWSGMTGKGWKYNVDGAQIGAGGGQAGGWYDAAEANLQGDAAKGLSDVSSKIVSRGTGSKGFGDRLASVFGGGDSGGNSGVFWRNAIIGGFSYWSEKQAADEARKRADNATVWGGPAFGGSEDLPEGFIRSPITGKGAPGESVASAIAFNSSDAGKIKTRPLFNPAKRKTRRAGSALLGGTTQITDLPEIRGLLDPSEGGVYG